MKKTVIIQGKVHEWTQKNINAFKDFGGYRIVFSTWKGEENVPKGCEVVFLEDPGPGPIQNFSRQLRGFNGVEEVEEGFLVKTRASKNLKIQEFNHEESFNMFLNFLETNFVVKNTYTTLQSVCAKYQNQSESLPFYIKEGAKLGDL